MKLDWINIYGINFTFSIFNKRKYYTIIGLICSILSLILMIVFAYLLGQDFLFRLNPQTIYSKHKPIDYQYYNLTSSELYLPWRINDQSGNAVDFTKLLFPFLYYETLIRNPITHEVIYTKEKVNYTKCNQTLNPSGIDVNDYYCFDFTKLNLGGSRNADHDYHLTLAFSFCPNDEIFEMNKCSMTNWMELNNILSSNNPWYFSFIYPEHNFEPNAKDEPMRIIYKIQSEKLSIFSYKQSDFAFQYVQMIDDQGLIIPTPKENRKFAFYETTFQYVMSPSYVLNGSSSIVFRMSFSMSKDNDIYSRRYIKFPEVLANIGGIMRIVIFAFEVLSLIINEPFLYSSLLNHFFDYNQRKPEDKTSTSIGNRSSIGHITPVSLSALNLTKQCVLGSSITPTPTMKNNLMGANLLKRKGIIQQRNIILKPTLTYAQMVKFMMFNSCYRKVIKLTTNPRYDAFSRGLSAMKSRVDISEYIRLINQSDMIAKEVVKEKKYNHMMTLKKVNPYNQEEIKYVYMDLLKWNSNEKINE